MASMLSDMSNDSLLHVPVYPGLENHRSHMNWISGKDQITIGRIRTLIGIISDRLESGTLEDRRSMLQFSGLELVSLRIALGFCKALLDQHVTAQFHLIWAAENIQLMKEFDFAEEDYLMGLRYVLRGVNTFNFLQKLRSDLCVASLPSSELEPFVRDLCYSHFDDFSPKVKTGALAARHFFYGVFGGSCKEQVQLLEEIVELDPNYYLWHLHMYSQYRRQRQEQKDSRNACSSVEVEAQHILNAVELASEDPLVVVSDCICVAELNKARKNWRQSVVHGKRQFNSSEDVANYIKSQTNKLLETHSGNLQVSICVADCFSSLLPYEFQDLNYAKDCIRIALEIYPNSSKAHHRMGMHFLYSSNNNKTGNYQSYWESMKEASFSCAKAVECDEENFVARIQLIKLLMSDPIANYVQIEAIMEAGLRIHDLCATRRARLHFWKGCFLLLTHDENPVRLDNDQLAALEWMKTCEVHSESLQFRDIFPALRECGWPKGKLIPHCISLAVEKLKKSGKVDVQQNTFVKLAELVKLFREYESARYKQTYNHRELRSGGRGYQGTESSNDVNHNRNNNYGRRGSTNNNGNDLCSFPNSYSNCHGTGDSSSEWTRPSRFSSSASANASVRAQKVTIIREPHPPNSGPGFNHYRERNGPTSNNN